MPKLPQVNGERLVRALHKRGWVVHRTSGSHFILKHPDGDRPRVIVPVHGRPLRQGTLAAILKEADMSAEELKELL